MRTPKKYSSQHRSGYALLIALCFLSISLLAYTSLMYWVTSNAKITKRNNLFNQSQAAAESATESVMANMMRDFNNQALGAASAYTTSANLPPTNGWPVLFSFSDTNGNANATSVSIGAVGWTNLPARYTGLYGLGQPCVIASQATPLNTSENLSATVAQNVWFGSIPIFQFAIFYNLDLEINPGDAMTINGRVHSNQYIYTTGSSSGAPLTFTTNVESSYNVYTTSGPNDPRSPVRSGNDVFNTPYKNQASSLSMPIGTNNDPDVVIGVLGIPPTGTDPKTDAGQSYEYNKADIIISNNSTSGNLSVYYFNQYQTPNQILIPMDVTNVDTTYTTNTTGNGKHATTTVTPSYFTNTYYSFTTNVSFYDYRESRPVQAVQVDVRNFNTWLTNAVNGGRSYTTKNTTGFTTKNHDVNGIYVYNNTPNTSSQLPAVRVVNGAQLPTNGLAVVTPFPLYVQGDYNTTTNGVNFSKALGDTVNTRPAALMGDAVTILSQNWSDTYAAGLAVGSRPPVSTTINAATLEGIVPSTAVNHVGGNYSGGLENFLRLLENWSSSTTLTYNGSIVVLFASQYATAPWNGSYYGVPTRHWGFDTRFNTQSLLPPMTPQVRVTIRNNWTTW